MFLKAKAESQLSGTSDNPVSPAALSIVSSSLSVEGKLISDGEIQVDGTVNGDIDCQVLTIGVSGLVVGVVIAEAIRIHGKLEGKIQAKSVFLASTATVCGDIFHESLAIEPGASIQGYCKGLPELETVQFSSTASKTSVSEKTPNKIPQMANPFKKPKVSTGQTKPDTLAN